MAFRIDEIKDKTFHINDRSELKLISPFSCMVAGCTGSGKSVLVLDWLKAPQHVFRENDREIYYFYGSTFQESFKDPSLHHVRFSSDIKLLTELATTKHESRILIILDDLMCMTAQSAVILDLYTKGSHHFNIDIVNIVQNIFHNGRGSTFITMKVNSQYFVIKQFIDETKLRLLARAVGVNHDELTAAYEDSLSKNRFAGVLIDNHISSNIKKITKLRVGLHLPTPVLYISDQKFDYYSKHSVIHPIPETDDEYYIDINMLKDKCG